jgi:hypothetical protein
MHHRSPAYLLIGVLDRSRLELDDTTGERHIGALGNQV